MPFPTRSEKKLGEILVELCLISPVQIHRILKKQDAMNKSKGYKIRLGEMLLRERMIDDIALAKAVGEQYNIDFLNLSNVDISIDEMVSFPQDILDTVDFVVIKRGPVDVTIAICEEPHEEIYKIADANHSGDVIFVSSPKSQINKLKEEVLKSLRSNKNSGTVNLSGREPKAKEPKINVAKTAEKPSIERPETGPGELIMPLPVPKEMIDNDPLLSSGDALDSLLPAPGIRSIDAAKETAHMIDNRAKGNEGQNTEPELPSTTPSLKNVNEENSAALEQLGNMTEPMTFDPLDLVPDNVAFADSFVDAKMQNSSQFTNPILPGDQDLQPQEGELETRGNIPVHRPETRDKISQQPSRNDNHHEAVENNMAQNQRQASPGRSGPGKMNSILKNILITGISVGSTSISFSHNQNLVNVYSKGANDTTKLSEIERHEFGEMISYLEGLLKTKLSDMEHSVRKKVKLKLGNESHLFQFLFAPTNPISMNINILDNSEATYSFSSLSLGNKYVEILKKSLTEHHGLIIVSGLSNTSKSANSIFLKIGSAILNFLADKQRKVLCFNQAQTPQLTGLSQVTVGEEHTPSKIAFSPGTLKTFLDSNFDNILATAPLTAEALKRMVNIALSETNTVIFMEGKDCLSSFMAVKKTGVSTSSLIEACKFIINIREVSGVCPFCKETFIITKDKLPPQLQSVKQLINMKAYKGKGCRLCKKTGESGKTLIFETMEVNSDLIDIDELTRTQKPLKKFLLESGLLQPLIKGAKNSLMSGRITFEHFLNLVAPKN